MAIPNRGPEVAAVTIVFLVLSWIVVLLRYYARIRLLKNFFLDDWLVGFCLILFSLYSGYGLAGTYWGVGRHISDLSLRDIRASLKVWYFCELFYSITAATLRVTVGIFLLRFAARKSHRVIIIGLNTIGILYNICYTASIVFQCIPLSYFWQRFDKGSSGMCFDPSLGVKLTLGTTVIAAVTDWVFGLLPIWIMWDLRLNRRKKIIVWLLLGLGALASTAPIVRLPYIAGLLRTTDFLWATTDVAIWSVVELGVGIIVISLPTLRPLVRSIPFFAGMSKMGSSNFPNGQLSSVSGDWVDFRGGYKSEFQLNHIDSSKG